MSRLLRLRAGPAAVALLLFVGAALPALPTSASPTPLYTYSPSSSALFENVTALAGVEAYNTVLDPDTVTRERNNGFLNGGRGACVDDFDEDGDDDIYVVGPGANQMFRNNGNFSFTDISASAGVDDPGYGMACASGDLDNDGDADIIVTNYFSHFILFRNNGNSTFTNMTNASGIDNVGPQTGVAMGDFDNDGLLDFFLAEYGKVNDRVFRNLGNFRFADKTTDARIVDVDFGFQPIAADYDRDGDQDVYVANDFGPDMLWSNQGNFTFADASRTSGARDPGGGMGTAWGDFDGDDDLDIHVGNYNEDGLWENRGGYFNDVGNQSGVDDNWTTWGVVWFDYDNDGHMDLYLGNGNVELARAFHQPNRLYHNTGARSFEEVTDGSGAESEEVTRGVATGDFDQDGKCDLYMLNVNAPALLLKNIDDTQNTWLRVKLQGNLSNRDGVGATVTAVVGKHRETQLVSSGSSYLSSNSKVLNFGLGNGTKADEVIVLWPSGLRQVVKSQPANQTITIVEEDDEDPIAVAGNVVANQGEVFLLNGSASSDNVRIVEWLWSVNVNGTLQSNKGRLALMTIYSAGTFQARLDVKDLFNRTATAMFTITVRPYAAAWVELGPDLLVAEGSSVTFVVTGGSSMTPFFELDCSFAWSMDTPMGTLTFSGPRVTHRFDDPGVFLMRVVVTDPQNATGNDTVMITVMDATVPVVRASVPTVVDEDVPVQLDASDTVDNDPTYPATGTFVWNYTSRSGPVTWTGKTVLAVFTDPGDFVLRLAATDQAGNTAAQTFPIKVRDTTKPVPSAGPDRSTLPGRQVVFSASASTDNDPTFPLSAQFAWTVYLLSGPVLYAGPSLVLTFDTPGLVRVELDAWDAAGNRAEAPDVVLVDVNDIVPPTPSAGGDRTVAVGETFTLDGSASTDNDPTLLLTGAFVWEFQEGSARVSLPGVRVTYAFVQAGTFPVRLSVVDAHGNSAAITIKVTAADMEPPVIVVEPLPGELTAGSHIFLNASGTHDNFAVSSVSWRVVGPYAFDQQVFGPEGSVVLSLPGDYNATVTVRDSAGNIATQWFIIHVSPKLAPGTGDEPVAGTTPGDEPGRTNSTDTAPPPGQKPTPGLTLMPVLAAALAAWVVVWVRTRRPQ